MAYIVMAHIAAPETLMYSLANAVMACVVMAYVVTAYVVMARIPAPQAWTPCLAS